MRFVRVTEPLGVFFDKSTIPGDVLEFAANRGTSVHAACAAYARRLPVMIENGGYLYFKSFRDWFDAYVARVLFVEEEFRDDQVYRIVGHPDMVAELTDGRVVVVDFKTPQAESATWRAQIAAYRYLVVLRLKIEIAGMALILNKEGNQARAILYREQASDWAAYLAALTAYRYFRG